MGERCNRTAEVRGSIPLSSTSLGLSTVTRRIDASGGARSRLSDAPMEDDLPPPIPAATLILMRPAPDGGPPEILMMERSETMAFAAGALVFPGGRIDDDDQDIAAALSLRPDAAARIAAIRETIEETGIAPGADARAGRPRGRRAARGARRRDALRLSARPSRPRARSRRPDPLRALVPQFPRGAAVRHALLPRRGARGGRPAAPTRPNRSAPSGRARRRLLAEIEAGRAHAIFPTRRNLERLARFASIDEARADAAAIRSRRSRPGSRSGTAAASSASPRGSATR